ncbi:MAG: hypothetical protein ACE5IH_07065 [Thermodesulfobacteriota bacterium]
MGNAHNVKEDEEIIKDLIENNLKFKEVYDIHEDYDKRLAEIDKRAYLSTEDQIERKKLQKLKLAEKDKMEAMLQRHREI